MPKKQTLIDKFIRNKDGQIVLGQYPNVPIILWLIFWALSKFSFPDHIVLGFEVISQGFLFIWAYLEITSGVSYARRALGIIVMTLLIIQAF